MTIVQLSSILLSLVVITLHLKGYRMMKPEPEPVDWYDEGFNPEDN